jgi:hypothetical protein
VLAAAAAAAAAAAVGRGAMFGPSRVAVASQEAVLNQVGGRVEVQDQAGHLLVVADPLVHRPVVRSPLLHCHFVPCPAAIPGVGADPVVAGTRAASRAVDQDQEVHLLVAVDLASHRSSFRRLHLHFRPHLALEYHQASECLPAVGFHRMRMVVLLLIMMKGLVLRVLRRAEPLPLSLLPADEEAAVVVVRVVQVHPRGSPSPSQVCRSTVSP